MLTLSQLLRLMPADWDGTPPSQSAEFASQRKQVTVLVTPTPLLPHNPRRISWQIVNQTGATIYLDNGNNPASTTGTPLYGQGAAASASLQEDRAVVYEPVYGIASVQGTVAVYEVVLVTENEI